MIDPPDNNPPGPFDDAPPETGRPLEQLRDWGEETSPLFAGRVRAKIYRRVAAKQLVTFWWDMPRLVLMEFLGVVMSLFSGSTKKEP